MDELKNNLPPGREEILVGSGNMMASLTAAAPILRDKNESPFLGTNSHIP